MQLFMKEIIISLFIFLCKNCEKKPVHLKTSALISDISMYGSSPKTLLDRGNKMVQ